MQNIKPFYKTKLFFLIILSAIVFLLYAKSTNFDFVNLDEDTLISNNITHLSSLKNIPNFFLTSCYFKKTSYYYRPVLTVSFSIETALFGFNKKVYHFTNIILFILSLYLMYVFSLKLNLSDTVSKFIILLFAVHPVFTSLPVWVPARNDTLLIIFILLSFINFINYIQLNKKVHLICFVLFFVLALFTKETAILLFILYPLFLYCFKYGIIKKQNLYILLNLFIIVIVYYFLRNCSVAKINITNYFANALQYLSNSDFGLFNYLFFFFVPAKVPAMLINETFPYKSSIVSLFFILIFIVFYYKNAKYRKPLLFAGIWFLVFLVPTFFQKEYIFLTHRLFVPSVGLLIFLSIVVEELTYDFYILKIVMFALFCGLFGCFFYLSSVFQNTYSNKQTFWQQAYTDAPNYHFVPYNLALIYLQQGNNRKYEEFMLKAYSSKNGRVHIFNVMPILIENGHIDIVKKLCSALLQTEETTMFYKIGANIIMSQICLKENDLEQAYKYLKSASELDNNNIQLKNKVKELETQIKIN